MGVTVICVTWSAGEWMQQIYISSETKQNMTHDMPAVPAPRSLHLCSCHLLKLVQWSLAAVAAYQALSS